MCNLYRTDVSGKEIAEAVDAAIGGESVWVGNYVAPGKAGPVILGGPGDREVAVMNWGFETRRPRKTAPKEGQAPYVSEYWTNARNLDGNLWRPISYPEQRCLVPFTRFSEPKAKADRKDAKDLYWWFTVDDQAVPCFAGIWRQGFDEQEFSFLTTEPNPIVAAVHPKAMPVILLAEDHDRWLYGSRDDALSLQAAYPSQLMRVE
jgi:putative SOS response-associated peptidase YedK